MTAPRIEATRRRRPARALRMGAVLLALALIAAACGSGRSSSSDNTTKGTTAGGSSDTTTGGSGAYAVDSSACTGDPTTGVSGDTIKIGTSLPQSGLYSAFTAILKGEKSYIQYINDKGGVTVAGKKYKIELVDKDDAYDAAKTVTNVQTLINDDKVFALFNVVGTKNNLAARDLINTSCIPNLLIASGAVQWGNMKYPWMLGSELVPYPLEMHEFVEYLKKNKPDAKIAVLAANDDFGQTYTESLKELIKGTKLTITKVQTYDPEGADVNAQVTDLASTGSDAWVLGAALLACPAALTAAANAGWKPITYMSGTCVSKVLLGAAGQAANNVLSVTPLLDPADPNNDTNEAMTLYKAQMAKYASDADVTDGIVAYGWTTGAMLVKILEGSAKLDRVSVMNAARNLKDVKGVGLQLPTSSWNTSADDWFIGESFQLIQYDATAKHTNPVGDPVDLDGQTAKYSPPALLNS